MDRKALRASHRRQIKQILKDDRVENVSDLWDRGGPVADSLFAASAAFKNATYNHSYCISQAKAYYDRLNPVSQTLIDNLGIMTDSRIPAWSDLHDIEETPSEETLEAFSEYQCKLAALDGRLGKE